MWTSRGRAKLWPWLVLAVSIAPRADAAELISSRESLPLPVQTIRLQPSTPGGPPPVITAVRLDPSGELLVAAGDDHVVRVLLAQSGQLLRELRGHEDWVVSVAISPDGRSLATAGSDHRVVVWDLGTGQQRWTLDALPGAVSCVAFSHDGQTLAIVGFGQPLQIVTSAQGRLVRQWACPCRDMRCIAFSPDDRLLAGGGRNGRIRVWDVAQGREIATFPAHRQRIRDLTFTPDGHRLITAGEDRVVRLWETSGWQPLQDLGRVPAKVLSLAALPDARLATACSDNMIRLWDLQRCELVSQLRGHEGSVAALDANDQWLVSAGFDATVRIWPLPEVNDALTTLRGRHAESLSQAAAESTTRNTSLEPID